MRLSSKHIIWLAIALGLAFHAAARALPHALYEPEAKPGIRNELTLVERGRLPFKAPGKGASTGGTGAAPNTLGTLEPPKAIAPSPPKSNPKGDQGTTKDEGNDKDKDKDHGQTKSCKRADDGNGNGNCAPTAQTANPPPPPDSARGLRSTGLAPPLRYTFANMAPWGKDRQTRSGLADWRPENALRNENEGAERALSKRFNRSLGDFAKRVYEGLKSDGADPAWATRGYNLVAALYIPGRGVRVSTIPRGDAAKLLLDNFQDRAPGLYRVTRGGRTANYPNNPHAEDGVVYQEEAQRFRENDGVLSGADDTFPEGSRVAVYGSWRFEEVGQEALIRPCQGKEKARVVGCERALKELGIDIVLDNYELL
ncbi:uncharacterized protein DSM5745_05045 [Aspergillus mulundensis]|uniref:Uncharacterized protein n=1 Tax=Aspergillus mulundensis TaxID=1810919 RepID=A0A3D8S5C8_9EURO|nr:hypothetical protein DSM5745_05045 [Aspergillus mulundensis]RDW81488.1 hypothetical protein DSM5745_05045 [Aspergillus mulundensis]